MEENSKKIKQILSTIFMLCFGIPQVRAMSYIKHLMRDAIILNHQERQLLEAIRNNDVQAVRNHIARGTNINFECAIGGTPLILATVLRNPTLVCLLLNAGAHINDKIAFNLKRSFNSLDTMSMNAVMMAAYVDDSEICEMLIAHGADITERDDLLYNALMIAALFGNTHVLPVLIKAHKKLLHSEWIDAPIEICDNINPFINDTDADGRTPLLLALFGALSKRRFESLRSEEGIDQLENTIKILLAAEADITIKDHAGLTIHDYANHLPECSVKKSILAILTNTEKQGSSS